MTLATFDAAAAGIAAFGGGLAFRPARLLGQPVAAPALQAARIAGTMIAALGLAGFLFATTFHFNAS